MRGIKAKSLREEARSYGYAQKGQKTLINGQVVNVGTRAVYQKLKKGKNNE